MLSNTEADQADVAALSSELEFEMAPTASTGTDDPTATLRQRARESDLPTDTKLDEFLRFVKNLETDPNPKIVVFSTFRATVNYLSRSLRSEASSM